VVTVYALGDMMIYNRHKRREYFAEQAALHDAVVYEAHKAVRHGSASQEQIALVEQDEIRRRADEEKNASKGPGIMTRVKGLLYSGLDKDGVQGYEIKKEEGEVGFEGAAAEDEGAAGSAILKAVGERDAGFRERSDAGRTGDIRNAVERAIEKEREAQSRGGPLDRLGTSATTGVDEETSKQDGGWFAFMSKR
jgi:hypothetical protein